MATAKKELEEVTGQASPYTIGERKRLPAPVVRQERPEYNPLSKRVSAAVDLSRLGKQAGVLGAGFLPGAGVADYFGQFPSMEGGTEPSAVENFQQGNYGTAALQGLGAMGDLALAVPVVGTAVGSVMKLPRAAQKMLQELPKPDELGFYSQVQKAVMDNPQQKGTGAQFLAQIQNTPNVKAEELQYTGLDKFLASKPTVTKTEIQDYLDTNKVQVQEVVLGGRTERQRINDALDEAGISRLYDVFAEGEFLDIRNNRELSADELPTALKNKLQEIEATPELSSPAASRFETYTLPGGTNYRELYLTLPTKQLSEAEARAVLGARPDARLTEADISFASNKATDQYRVPAEHSVSTEADVNRLAQLRVNDRVVDGKNTLFIEEIQSDWHQTGRKKGYFSKARLDDLDAKLKKDGKLSPEEAQEYNTLTNMEGFPISSGAVPDAPFKTSWDELTLKRALKLASDEGYDQIAFTTGKTQADRYGQTKKIESVALSRSDFRAYDKSGKIVIRETGVTPEDLSRLIGPETAEKLLEQPPEGTLRSLFNLDLSIGGEGMQGFYDKMLPKKLKELGKRYGVQPSKTTMNTPDGPVEIWAMPLPDELKEVVSTRGQPLFQIGAGAVGTAGIMSLTGGEAEAAQ